MLISPCVSPCPQTIVWRSGPVKAQPRNLRHAGFGQLGPSQEVDSDSCTALVPVASHMRVCHAGSRWLGLCEEVGWELAQSPQQAARQGSRQTQELPGAARHPAPCCPPQRPSPSFPVFVWGRADDARRGRCPSTRAELCPAWHSSLNPAPAQPRLFFRQGCLCPGLFLSSLFSLPLLEAESLPEQFCSHGMTSHNACPRSVCQSVGSVPLRG